MNRKIAIINYQQNRFPTVFNLIGALDTYKISDEIYLFSTHIKPETMKTQPDNVKLIPVVVEQCSRSQLKNKVIQYFKNELNYDGFLYMFEDCVELGHDPTQFVDELENMMQVLNYPIWYSTYTDECNYVLTKYNPRVSIVMDNAEMCSKLKTKKLHFTSHANTKLVVIDLANCQDEMLYFNEAFSVPMFYIIESLARHRQLNNGKQLYFMNQYLTVDSEYALLNRINITQPEQFTSEIMEKEDKIFKQLNINIQPDNNINMILERLYSVLKDA